MKVIERAEGRAECPRCRSVFEFDTEDIKTDVWSSDYISCPVCREKIFISKDHFKKTDKEKFSAKSRFKNLIYS